MNSLSSKPLKKISRRQFLRAVGLAAAGIAAAGCQPSSTPTIPPSPSTATPNPTRTPIPSDTPGENLDVTATSTESVPWNPLGSVVIGQQVSYDRKEVRQRLQAMLEDMGGIQDIVPTGARVAIKVNLTGGPGAYYMEGVPATESVVTHPEVVRALGELLIDAGASEIFVVESVDGGDSYAAWGYRDIVKSLNATLIDLNKPDPYPEFTETTVGPAWMVYENFIFNNLLNEVDTFISAAKMKCHILAGITLSMKNLVGLVPHHLYRLDPSDNHRTALHEDVKTRLPRIIVDLNMARPIHLALIDGIKTIEAGEGTWAEGVRQVTPGLMLAGKNALMVDTIGAALMAFDPLARYPALPFERADNYLNLAYNLGLGTNLLEEIEVIGPAIDEIIYPFAPATGYRS